MTAARLPLSAYPHHHPLPTRWADNDVYGHVNNAAYYAYFDTAVNTFLLERGVLDLSGGEVIGLVVENGCRYFAPLRYPESLVVGLGTAHLGTSSVRYHLGVFRQGEAQPSAEGHFVHVYVDRASRRPAALPPALRAVLEGVRLKTEAS